MSGKVTLDGRDVTGASPRDLHGSGVGFVPADRHRFGLVLSFPITDNVVLNDYHSPPYRPRAWSANDEAIRARAHANA